VDAGVVDRIFELLVRDFAGVALNMVVSQPCTPEQEQRYRSMLRKPVLDPAESGRIWSGCVLPLRGRYAMRP
jgi:acyl-CoA dehydrogenase